MCHAYGILSCQQVVDVYRRSCWLQTDPPSLVFLLYKILGHYSANAGLTDWSWGRALPSIEASWPLCSRTTWYKKTSEFCTVGSLASFASWTVAYRNVQNGLNIISRKARKELAPQSLCVGERETRVGSTFPSALLGEPLCPGSSIRLHRGAMETHCEDQ